MALRSAAPNDPAYCTERFCDHYCPPTDGATGCCVEKDGTGIRKPSSGPNREHCEKQGGGNGVWCTAVNNIRPGTPGHRLKNTQGWNCKDDVCGCPATAAPVSPTSPPVSPTPTPILSVNNTMPCDMAVWTQAGIDELQSSGTMQQFNNPVAGSTLTDSKRARISNMDGAISAGYIYCFGPENAWDFAAGIKCSGQTKSAPKMSLLECKDKAVSDPKGPYPLFQYQPRTRKCKVLGECSSPKADTAGWSYYAVDFVRWPCARSSRRCTGKTKKWKQVSSLYECQKKAEEKNAVFYSFKSGSKKKCAITNTCSGKVAAQPVSLQYTIFDRTSC